MKLLKILVAAIALAVVSGGSAYAFSFGPTTVAHDGLNRGAGKGSFSPVGWDGARLVPTTKDLRRDNMRTYIEGKAGINGSVVKVQSGRRGDGYDTWKTTATKTGYAGRSTSGMQASAKVCMDRSWAPDPCKTSKTAWW